ncbi:hypothetical protein Thiosp_02932 [Thiorhodovibrio litoralis]|nr:hypothetical protein Thiosp_02932 [Thiorhodovibrio litoralis]
MTLIIVEMIVLAQINWFHEAIELNNHRLKAGGLK